jgi:hypothetical protein
VIEGSHGQLAQNAQSYHSQPQWRLVRWQLAEKGGITSNRNFNPKVRRVRYLIAQSWSIRMSSVYCPIPQRAAKNEKAEVAGPMREQSRPLSWFSCDKRQMRKYKVVGSFSPGCGHMGIQSDGSNS